MKRSALGVRDVAHWNAGEEIGLAFNGRRAAALRQIGDRGGAAEIVGERHDGAAVQRTETIVEVLANGQFGNDLVRRNVDYSHAEQSGEWRLLFGLRIHRKIHWLGSRQCRAWCRRGGLNSRARQRRSPPPRNAARVPEERDYL